MAISKIWSQEEAASKIHDLEQKNRSLVAKIMKLQGETDQVTDVDIQVRFNKLYDAIRTWIQNVQRDLRQKGWSFKDIFQQEVQDDPSTLSRMGILLHEDDEQDPGLAIWDDNRLDIRWAWWLGKHTTCIYVVLSIMIWRYLEEGIFHHPFPIGVPKSARNMFGEIIKSMKMTDDGEGMCISLTRAMLKERSTR
ncbi:hypothetical protein BJ875DRAFT_387789 [Amylocarpus encephaloides]|uniref:Uncharacterized protein n=1 Tax=Amylocarpus encephaloides TaxID=45428 RepID=A0A9P7YA42_9HELO|nr:hypothetical protein BJ875DRAFT_387789 [Amylocarpus encephaloides]